MKNKDGKVVIKHSQFLNKDSYLKGGVDITPPNIAESQTVIVKGTKALRKDKKPVKATWY